jgi:hypothetical protein
MSVTVTLLGCCTAVLDDACLLKHIKHPKHRNNVTTGKKWQSVVYDDDDQLKPQHCQRVL